MEKISSAVESDSLDTFLLSTLCDSLSDYCSSLDTVLALALCCKNLIVGSSSAKSLALLIINNLYVNLLVAAENDHTRTLGSTIDMLTDTVVNSSSSFNST